MLKYSLALIFLLAVNFHEVNGQTTGKPGKPEAGATREAATTSQRQSIRLPANIKLILELEELPGRDNPKSFWEAGYEIRVVDWRTIVEKTKAGEDFSDAGLLLTKSSFAHRSLLDNDNRRLIVALPVTGALLERLQQQQNSQAFSLRSAVRLYDAQLDRNFAFRVDRVWQFKLFPDGEATITIKIKPDGAFSVFGPIPKTLPPGYTVVGPPSRK
jgi:hypothetical protein